MKLTLLLADAAQEAAGKVHALGVGWNITVTPAPPMAVLAIVDVGWDETNKDITLKLELVDADGKPVTVPGAFGEQPLAMEATTQVGRPPGLPRGSEIRTFLTVNIGEGLPLLGGQRYEWRASLNGQSRSEWTQSFYVQPTPPGSSPPTP